jgi:hypothetical protein
MIDAEICKLNEQEPGRSLDKLEAGIWAGVDARLRANRISRVVFSCQAAVLAIALFGSVAAGTRAAMDENPAAGLDVFSIRKDLTPTSRLIDH